MESSGILMMQTETEYTWDYHNRLVKVQQFNAPDNAQNVKVEYTYDAMNRRIERGSYNGGTSAKTQYAYGRNGVITYQEKNKENIKTTRTFSYLNDQIIGFIDRTSDTSEALRIVLTDIQGSITEVYDEDNNLLWKSGYTAFGIKAGETTALIDFDGLYTGCDYDAETGLTYHWNRWRGEDGSNWLSEDPARDGMNWYGYAGCNPVNYIDSIGLFYYGPDGQHSSSEPYNRTVSNENVGVGNIQAPTVIPSVSVTNGNLSGDTILTISSDYGVESKDPYSISGKFLGENNYKSPEETYKKLKEVTQNAGLLGKTYGVDDYVCTNFGKDVIALLGIDVNHYYPSGNLVRDNLKELIKNDSVFELGKTDKLDAGVYAFYKVYDNDYNGHTGFLYIDKEQNQTILHNGYNPSGEESVNEFTRGKTNFNHFFKKNPKNPVYLKQIFILEDE